MTPDANTLEHQIQFARHNFDNHQALICASDAKAGVMVTLMGRVNECNGDVTPTDCLGQSCGDS